MFNCDVWDSMFIPYFQCIVCIPNITSNYIKGSLLLMQVFCFNNRGERVYNEGKEFTELRIGFSKLTTSFEPIKNHDNPLEVVRCANILGLTVSNDLK